MCTVVYKLFQLVGPDIAVFGEKDLQQLLIIKKMVADLSLPIDIQSGATQRAEDGLALSSRNQYLSASERALAPLLWQTLQTCGAALTATPREPPASIIDAARVALEQAGFKLITSSSGNCRRSSFSTMWIRTAHCSLRHDSAIRA